VGDTGIWRVGKAGQSRAGRGGSGLLGTTRGSAARTGQAQGRTVPEHAIRKAGCSQSRPADEQGRAGSWAR
jgi:hypothetical protein